jgi:hypothetical protein
VRFYVNDFLDGVAQILYFYAQSKGHYHPESEELSSQGPVLRNQTIEKDGLLPPPSRGQVPQE